MAPAPPKGNNAAAPAANAEQNRASLTVMIPRAKYYSQQAGGNVLLDAQSQPHLHQHPDRYVFSNKLHGTNLIKWKKIIQTGHANWSSNRYPRASNNVYNN